MSLLGSLLLRTTALAGGCVGASVAAWRLCEQPLEGLRPLGEAGFADLVTGGSAATLLLCVAWLVATTLVELAACVLQQLLPGCRAARAAWRLRARCTPETTRRLVGLSLGLAVGVGVAGPAAGDTGLGGLPLPDRTSGPAAASAAPRTAPPPAEVVVRPGDSLWTIAAGLLGAGAGDAEVAHACHRLHRVNRDGLGDDPDLIFPGTRLEVPDSLAPHGKESP